MRLFEAHPWLTRASTCRFDWDGQPVSPNDAGAWGIGNGLVFAHTGLVMPPGRLEGIVGPHYQTRGDHSVEGAFGDCWLELVRGSMPSPVRSGRIWRPAGTGIVVSELVTRDATIRIVDCAPPGVSMLLRIIEWEGRLDDGDVLRIHFPRGRPLEGTELLGSTYRSGQAVVLGIDRAGRTGVGFMDFTPNSDPGDRCVAWLATGSDLEDARRVLDRAGDPLEELGRTDRFWRTWLAVTACPPPWSQRTGSSEATAERFGDLIDAARVALKVQHALPSGGSGPMVHFKGSWARDNNGIVRGFLAVGAHEEARATIEYFYRAAAHLGEIPNRVPLDLPVDGGRSDWSSVPVAHTEVPSWLILQHWWWLEADGDEGLVRDHWPFLVRCLEGHRPSEQGLLPFHGDETYLHGALLSVFPDRVGHPHGLIAHVPGRYPGWSLEATAAFAVACRAMGRMAERFDRSDEAARFLTLAASTRRALETAFWQESNGWYAPALYPVAQSPHPFPFAPVNAALPWMGYESDVPGRLRKDLESVIQQVGFGRAGPGCPFDVGTTAGMLLYDLVAAGSDRAPNALAHVARCASRAGDWAEINGPSGSPDGGYDRARPNRLRPWEAGIALEGMVRYFRDRRPADEPDLEGIGRPTEVGSTRPEDRAQGPEARIVRVTTRIDQGRAGDSVQIVEPAALASVSSLAALLFDPGTGLRRPDRLEFDEGVLVCDRSTLKPPGFWLDPVLLDALDRFTRAGGEVVGLDPPPESPPRS